MINKSFQILRTNPLLTTNYKIVISSDYKLYLESFDSNKQLSDTKYKHVIVNKDDLLENIIYKFYDKLPVNIAYDVKYDSDNNIMYSNFDNQFDDIYYSGAKNVEDQWYNEEFEYFAPLYIRPDNIPSNFVILRVDEPAIYKLRGEKYKIENLNKENFRSELIDKWKCVNVFNLTKTSDLGVFLTNNYVENLRFPKKVFDLDIKKYNFSRWYGMDYNSGVYTEKSLLLDDKLYYENPDFNLESYISTGYRDNKLIFPSILNLKFLFDDIPATADVINKWSLNRYYGFYTESLESVNNLTTYVTPTLKNNIKLINNIFIKVGTSSENINPFVENWNTNNVYFIYVDNNLYKVERYSENNNYVYKVISDKKLDNIFDVSSVYDNTVTIVYDDVNKRNNIVSKNNNLLIDEFVDKSGITDSMYADLYLIKINGNYHVIKNDKTTVTDEYGNIVQYINNYYIQTDYAINSNNEILEYWIGGKTSEYYKKYEVYNKNDKNKLPLIYTIYRIKFSDIKDFDFDRVNTHFSDFEYETSEFKNTEEIKLYATEYRDISIPKSYKINEKGEDGQYKVKNVSSEYISTDELFEIKDNDLSDIWRKNQSICKWGYQNSISHNDYPYKLNNSLKTGNVYNKTTNPFNLQPNIIDKNLDYFYRIGKFHNTSGETIYYLNQSTNIYTDLLDQTHSEKFNVDLYFNSNVDYFTYFFNNKELYYDFGNYYIKQYEKYSLFTNGDKYENSSTVFKGLKINIQGVENYILTNDTYNKIQEVLIDDTKLYNDYKFTIILNDRYSGVTDSYLNDKALSNNTIIDTTKNGIHIILNEKFKNVLVIINVKIPILSSYEDLNMIDIFGENYGLYYAKTLTGDSIDNNYSGTDKYNPAMITAYNFIESLNNMNNINEFENYITYYYIDKDGISGKTTITDYINSTLIDIPSWKKKVPPFILTVETPTSLVLKKKSYINTALDGPEYNIYDKYKITQTQKLTRDTDIDDYLARKITLNETENVQMMKYHKESVIHTNKIYRYSGSYEPIFKNIPLFNSYDIWSGNTYYKDKNYNFDLSLTNFGIIEENILSKVNSTENLLKLQNVENDKSIYPLLDEFGYTYSNRFIFKSGWDNDFFIESIPPTEDEYQVGQLFVTLNYVSTGTYTGTLTASYKNSGSIPRNGIVTFYYLSPTGSTYESFFTSGVTILGNNTEIVITNVNLVNIYGLHQFKTDISPSELALTNYIVTPLPPKAKFTPTTANITAGNSVTFNYVPTAGYGTPTYFLWNFENGVPTTSNSQNVTVTYPSHVGSPFNVRLFVSNLGGSDDTLNTYNNIIQVNQGIQPPVASFTPAPANTYTNTYVNFTYNGTGGSPTSYSWTFNGGTPSTSTLANPVVKWSSSGTFSVSLTVSNSAGSSNFGSIAKITTYTPPTSPPDVDLLTTPTLLNSSEGYVETFEDRSTAGTNPYSIVGYYYKKSPSTTWISAGSTSSSVDVTITPTASVTTYDAKLTIKDNVTNITYTDTIYNAFVVYPISCFSINTPIPMYDGTWKRLGDLKIGDELKTFYIDDFIDSSVEGWEDWTTTKIKANIDKTIVKEKVNYISNNYYIINNEYEVTGEHRFLIKKKGKKNWSWVRVKNLNIGDKMFDINKKEIIINSIDFVEHKLEVVLLNVENLDCFFANGIFVHNYK
jgi:PKD repeat protein